MRVLLQGFALALVALLTRPALAEDFPSRPITILVPLAPGGGVDFVARTIGQKLSEYHTGYRAFSRSVLEALPLEENSNDFVFDNQMLVQIRWFGFRTGEVSCPTRYFAEASSINFSRSITYGLGCLWNCVLFNLVRWGIHTPPFLSRSGRRLVTGLRPAAPVSIP